jgi:hypothetical protein
MDNTYDPSAAIAALTNAELSARLADESRKAGWGSARATYLGTLHREIAARVARGDVEGLDVALSNTVFSDSDGMTIFRQVEPEPHPED